MRRLEKALTFWLPTLFMFGGCGDPPGPGTITVTCDPASVAVGRTTQCSASARDQDGQPLTVSHYSWTSSDEAIAKVSAEGAVSTFAEGTVTLIGA